jgi:type IV fimbrial biogenesis protein FimT
MLIMNRKQLGFTIIELLITVVVISIVLTVAIPSFQSSIEKNNVTASISEFSASLRLARTEAVKRGRVVVVCPTNNQATCSGIWANGWLVFEDTDGSSSYSAAADDMIQIHGELDLGSIIEWSDSGSAIWDNDSSTQIEFTSRGLINTPSGTFKICSRSRKQEWARSLVIGLVGSLRYGIDSNNDSIFEDESGTNLTCPDAGVSP